MLWIRKLLGSCYRLHFQLVTNQIGFFKCVKYPFNICPVITELMSLGQLTCETYQIIAAFGKGPQVWVVVLQHGKGQLPLFLSNMRRERQRHTQSERDGDRKGGWWGENRNSKTSLVSGAGKQSQENKWEANTQPQEAIKRSKDQLGPSRWWWLCLLWSSLASAQCVWQRASRCSLRKQRGSFHLLSNLNQRIPTSGSRKVLLLCFLCPPQPRPPSQVQVIREDNYLLLEKVSFYRRGR